MGIGEVATIVLLLLKCFELIQISWWWVFAPMLFELAAWAFFFFFVFFYHGMDAFRKAVERKHL